MVYITYVAAKMGRVDLALEMWSNSFYLLFTNLHLTFYTGWTRLRYNDHSRHSAKHKTKLNGLRKMLSFYLFIYFFIQFLLLFK